MLYDNAYEEFNKGNIVWRRVGGSHICAVLVDTEFYTPYRDHMYFDKVPLKARVGLPRRLFLRDMRDGKCDAEPLPFTCIVWRRKACGIVVFNDTGDDATSPLLAYIPLDTDPVDVFMVAYAHWNENGIFTIKMHGDIAEMEAARIPFTGVEWESDDADNPAHLVAGKMEVWNIYGKVEHFPYRPEVEPWAPPYPYDYPPTRWKVYPPVGESPEDMLPEGAEMPNCHPYIKMFDPPFLPPWALPHGQPWRPDDWSPQNGKYPVPFPVKPDWMRPEPIPPHFNPKCEGEWGTAFQSKPWLHPKPPLLPVIPEGRNGFFCDEKHIKIRRGASAELRFYIADAHDHLIHHIGESGRDVTFSMKRIFDDGSEMRLTLDDKIIFLPTIPGEPVVIVLDQEETLVEGIHAFELVLHLGSDRYIASEGAIEITPAFGTIGDARPRRIFPDIIYVKDYGAKGDGVTDDTKAFQDALAAAGETGVVYVDAGEYCLSTDIEGRFIALGKVEWTCAGSATLTNMYEDYVRMYGDETIHGVKTFADTAIFQSGASIAGGANITGGATINGGMTVGGGSATFAKGINVSSGATITGGATVSGGMIVSGTISGYVTSAGHATSADSAGSAGSAGHATTATSATNAGSATNAAHAENAENAVYASGAGSAAKIGTATIGGNTNPVYISKGTPVALTATVGGSAQPVWLSSGHITALSGNIGDKDTPVYISGGVIVPCDSDKTADGDSAEKPQYDLVVKNFRFTSGALINNQTGYGIIGDVYTPNVKGKRFYVSGNISAAYLGTGDYSGDIFVSSGGLVKRAQANNSLISGMCVCIHTTTSGRSVANTSAHYSSFISSLEKASPMRMSELARYRITGHSGGTTYFFVASSVSDALSVAATAATTNADSVTSFIATPVTSSYVSEEA